MSILIIVEHDNKTMNSSTSHVLSAAKKFKEKIVLLVAGFNCEAVAKESSVLEGVDEVLLADNECYESMLVENLSELVLAIDESFTSILASSSTFGKNLLPRIAALLDVAQVSDVIDIIDNNTVSHPIYAGNAIETVRLLDNKKVLTIRTTAFDTITSLQNPCEIKRIDNLFDSKNSKFISHQLSTSTRPELGNAKIVVSGGRGLQSAEKFKLVEELADVLGAAVGASRAAVDAGFVPNDYQVGQTGKIVAPNLYIALGISGAVQHMAGMKDSKIIVAINKDEDAPIFQIANYGLVGDVFVLVPELIEQLKQI